MTVTAVPVDTVVNVCLTELLCFDCEGVATTGHVIVTTSTPPPAGPQPLWGVALLRGRWNESLINNAAVHDESQH